MAPELPTDTQRGRRIAGAGKRAATEGRPLPSPAGAESVGRGRRLILCLDGTANSPSTQRRNDQGFMIAKPTNVLKLARAVLPWAQGSARYQVVYYDQGVGSLALYPGGPNQLMQWSDQALGGFFGGGFEANVEDALQFLTVNFHPGDAVFIFGFSRGASTARCVTKFLEWAGGVPEKSDAYYLPRFFRRFLESRGAATARDLVVQIRKERGLKAGREGRSLDGQEKPDRFLEFRRVDVTFLGVWDTVMALGSRFEAVGKHTSSADKQFLIDEVPARCVRHARQALAVDEKRYDYRPEIWIACEAHQTLEQRWFAGAHSDVGGSYPDDGLANVALDWMVREAKGHGLEVDRAFLGFYRPYWCDRLHKSHASIFRFLDWVRGRMGKGKRSLVGHPASANLTLDPSIVFRMLWRPGQPCPGSKRTRPAKEMDREYRPDNVLQFLAERSDLAGYLKSLGLGEPDQVMPPDVFASIEKHRLEKRRNA